MLKNKILIWGDRMKKQIALILAGALTVCMASCNGNQIYETTIHTTEAEKDAIILQSTESNVMMEESISPSNDAFEANALAYEDPFESFMEFPSGQGHFFGKETLYPEKSFAEGAVPFVFFRVIGVEEEYVGDFTVYHVQLVDAYGIQNYDTEKVYRMAWRGHLEDQLYGRPALEIGEVYGRFLALSEEVLQTRDLWQAGLIFAVEEEGGKRYLYGYGIDLSDMACKIAITDPEENSIYKQGKHDKAIAELAMFRQELPTFDYKCEADAFYAEILDRSAYNVSSSKYINDFEEFGLFPIDRFTSELYHEKSSLYPDQLLGEGAIRIVVEGIDHFSYDGNMTIYKVRILEYYGSDEDVDTEKIYFMGYRGSPKNPLHDRPALQVGKEYLRFGSIHLDNTVIQASLMAPIEYVNGEAYVYGYGFDFSHLACAIEITDGVENQIFTPGIYDKYIRYALMNDIVLPTFDYKCELYALLKELGISV